MRERWGAALAFAFPLWAGLVAIGFWYAADRGIPLDVARAILPAFLLEIVLYLLSGLAPVRSAIARWPSVRIALALTALAPVSWLLLTIPSGTYSWINLLAITALAAAAAFWYVLLPRHLASDLGFLIVMAAPIVLDLFDALYPDPARRLPAQVLGVIMWYRTGLVAALCIRKVERVGFGFVPQRTEWLIGVQNFLLFLPVGAAVGWGIGFVRFRDVSFDGRLLLIAILTFVGVLWVLAVAEEFFFRGLLQQHLSKLFGNKIIGLIAASIVFGFAHIAYRQFPNWSFALLATLAGLFYGRAYLQAGSIRAAMVTHALVVTTWKVFLTSP